MNDLLYFWIDSQRRFLRGYIDCLNIMESTMFREEIEYGSIDNVQYLNSHNRTS